MLVTHLSVTQILVEWLDCIVPCETLNPTDMKEYLKSVFQDVDSQRLESCINYFNPKGADQDPRTNQQEEILRAVYYNLKSLLEDRDAGK